MDSSLSAMPKLTKHDQDVLKFIVKQAKLPDTDIAKKMGLSPQAVFKIRHKLEQSGVIQGYQPILDLKKVGINVLAFLFIKLTPEVWAQWSEEQVIERMKKMPLVMNAYRVPGSHSSHILLLGFRDLPQLEKYLLRLQTKFANEVEIQQVYSFSTDKIITQSPLGLLHDILEKKEFSLDEFLLKKK